MKHAVSSFARNCLWHWPVAAVVLWAAASAGGMWLLWRYAETPGIAAPIDNPWPSGTAIELGKHDDTLVMFCHPHCPCSRASIAELARIVARCKDPLTPWVVFYKPSGADTSWDQTDLWRSAAAIPGAHLVTDADGSEAKRFRATTSGQTFLYNREGQLLFEGGITGARGHEGDNAGQEAIVDLINTGNSMCRVTPVFGCPIVEQRSSN